MVQRDVEMMKQNKTQWRTGTVGFLDGDGDVLEEAKQGCVTEALEYIEKVNVEQSYNLQVKKGWTKTHWRTHNVMFEEADPDECDEYWDAQYYEQNMKGMNMTNHKGDAIMWEFEDPREEHRTGTEVRVGTKVMSGREITGESHSRQCFNHMFFMLKCYFNM